MIKSMTGFGKGETGSKFGSFIVEIRTVNHRFFDVSSRIPNSLNQLEDKVKHLVHGYVRRGKVNLSLMHKKSEKNFKSVKLDEEAISRYYQLLKKVRNGFKIKDDIKLSHILSFPDVFVQEQEEHDLNLLWPIIEKTVAKAAIDCNKMREKEGRALYRDLSKRIEEVSHCIKKIAGLAPGVVSQQKHKLDARVRAIMKRRNYDIDKARIETEIALFARQCDVTEEITRARSHIAALRNALNSSKEAGRRLDFILQELQREVNTLGSKAGDVKISRLVVDIKSEIEKIREQVQNVE
ncbi:MAG: YicC family protein [Candidatus Omnitrophica bacterium]|nr:YicC family protein [Candidatus Omnitrophota bacterium]MBU4457300.1 YicC family protein [Candidatus Omnitrophota bacterium]